MNPKRIVFLGTHGQFNIGDELLLETFLTELGVDNRYFVNSYDPDFTSSQLTPPFEAEVFHTAEARGKFLRYLLKCDLLFFGGGSIIKELYASVGRNRYATLIMVLLTVTFTRQIARKPIVMSNIGIGPLHTKWGERLARWILRQVNIVSVRDQSSYATCQKIGLKMDRIIQVPDAVFINEETKFTVACEEAGATIIGASEKLRVALNLNYNIENPENWETFTQNLEDGLRALNASQPLEIHTLPMQSQFNPDNDYKTLAAFRQRIPEIEVHLHRPESYCDVADIIANCDLLLSERLHALVIAAIVGKPFLALMYDVKVRELVSMLEMEDYALDVNHPFDPDAVKTGVEALQSAYDTVGAHLRSRSCTLNANLEDYFRTLKTQLGIIPRA